MWQSWQCAAPLLASEIELYEVFNVWFIHERRSLFVVRKVASVPPMVPFLDDRILPELPLEKALMITWQFGHLDYGEGPSPMEIATLRPIHSRTLLITTTNHINILLFIIIIIIADDCTHP